MSFAFPGLLEVHRAKMHNVTPLPSCKSCNMVFRRIMGLINHWRTGVPHVKDRDGIKLLGCDICDSFNIINGFRDKEEIAEHTRAVHGPTVLIDSTNFEKPLCPLCQRGFTYRKGVIEHIQILHGEHLVVDLIGAQDPAEQKRLIDELQYRCHYCPKTFRVKRSLLQHLEKFHQDTSGYTQPRPGSPLSTFKGHSVKAEEFNEWLLHSPADPPGFGGAEQAAEDVVGGDDGRGRAGAGGSGGGEGGSGSADDGCIRAQPPPPTPDAGPTHDGHAAAGDRAGRGRVNGGGRRGGELERRPVDQQATAKQTTTPSSPHRPTPAATSTAQQQVATSPQKNTGSQTSPKGNKKAAGQIKRVCKRPPMRNIQEALDEYRAHLALVRPPPPQPKPDEVKAEGGRGGEAEDAEISFKDQPANDNSQSGESNVTAEVNAEKSSDDVSKSASGQKSVVASSEESSSSASLKQDNESCSNETSLKTTPDESDAEGESSASFSAAKKPAKKKKKSAFRLSTKTNKSKKDAVVDIIPSNAPAPDDKEASTLNDASLTPTATPSGGKRSLRSNTPKEPPAKANKRKGLAGQSAAEGEEVEEEEVEECLEEDCQRTFSSYFSMMRHVALTHRQEKTADLLKLKLYSQLQLPPSATPIQSN